MPYVQRSNLEWYKDKSILVTGGVGSIGSEIVRRLLSLEPKVIRVLDNNETALFYLKEEINSPRIRTLLGDIRDKERLTMACEGIDVIFHAAALKHVPLCEYNPFEAVKSNVIGTQNVLDAALDKDVSRFILISTDKAVEPGNVMGATKLLSERLTISANNYAGKKLTIFSCVRLGNVMNSRGSVIPLFKSQIEKGQKITVTDPEMTRFMMSLEKAVDLILLSGIMSKGGEIFILKMSSVKIMDLAEVMLEELMHGAENPLSTINIIGRRPGEKMHERLMTCDEAELASDDEHLFILNRQGGRGVRTESYCSELTERLSKEQLRKMLKDAGAL